MEKKSPGTQISLDMSFGKSFTKIVIIDFSSHYFLFEEKNILYFYLPLKKKQHLVCFFL